MSDNYMEWAVRYDHGPEANMAWLTDEDGNPFTAETAVRFARDSNAGCQPKDRLYRVCLIRPANRAEIPGFAWDGARHRFYPYAPCTGLPECAVCGQEQDADIHGT